MMKNNILLRDIMTRGVTSVPMDITLREVAKIMVDQDDLMPPYLVRIV